MNIYMERAFLNKGIADRYDGSPTRYYFAVYSTYNNNRKLKELYKLHYWV